MEAAGIITDKWWIDSRAFAIALGFNCKWVAGKEGWEKLKWAIFIEVK
jgi:hypothetical protein